MLESMVDTIKSRYAAVAESADHAPAAGVKAVAEAFGYTAEQLAAIPATANMGLSCGNPTAMAGLKPGETVLDLGCGAGLDVFLAAPRVGPGGKAIGIDMTPAMIQRARENARHGPDGRPYENVEFHLAAIDQMPLPDGSVDCVISNCVINLAPDKPAVFREVMRVLKPGGRLAVSDIALKKELPEDLAKSVAAWVGCIAGAVSIEEYHSQLRAAGFKHVEVVDSGVDLNAYGAAGKQAACCSSGMDAPTRSKSPLNVLSCGCGSRPPGRQGGRLDKVPLAPGEASGAASPSEAKPAPEWRAELAELIKRYDLNEYAASVKVFAVKDRSRRRA